MTLTLESLKILASTALLVENSKEFKPLQERKKVAAYIVCQDLHAKQIFSTLSYRWMTFLSQKDKDCIISLYLLENYYRVLKLYYIFEMQYKTL